LPAASNRRLKKLWPHQLPTRSDVLGIEFEHVVHVEEEHLGAR
jgi:hypothetical protein